MPTYEADAEFFRDWRRLTPEQHRRFGQQFAGSLTVKAGRPPRRGLGIERFEGHEGVFEFIGRRTAGRYLRTAHLRTQTMSISFGCAWARTTSIPPSGVAPRI